MFRPRTLALLGLIALSAAACGRRGPLEPQPGGGREKERGKGKGRRAAPPKNPHASPTATPPKPAPPTGSPQPKTGAAAVNTLPAGIGLSAGASAPDEADELPSAAVAAPTGIPAPVESSSRRRKGYVIPKEPFPLDPLL
ncbi:hypothetical protein ACQVP2_10310 [Methylobacterium aquaticum]|uniref:hypothetical protein n=1 Tax=Methylobacterium aquaticum TaxID=270351 RepID=UPI003D16E509